MSQPRRRGAVWSGVPLFYYLDPHLGHAKHLCHLVSVGEDLDIYKRLVRDAKFICKKCGRAAARAENLCQPVPL